MFSGKTTGRGGMGFFTTALFPFSPHPCLPRVRSQATITISSPVNHGTITQEGNHIQTVLALIERFSYDLEKLFGKCSFYQPMDEKIKTWPLRFPTKENPYMEKALFDWPIVLQYDVKAKYQLISRKFSGMKFFHPSVCLCREKKFALLVDQPKEARVRQTNQITPFPFVCCFRFFPTFSFQGHTKIALVNQNATGCCKQSLKYLLML